MKQWMKQVLYFHSGDIQETSTISVCSSSPADSSRSPVPGPVGKPVDD